MPKKRYPSDLVVRVDSLIRRQAEAGRKTDPDYSERGLVNATLVKDCLPEARELMRRYHDELVASYLSIRIPLVLPAPSPTERTAFLTLPGLDLPAWLPVPPESNGDPGWKFQPDITPNQLERIIDHRTEEIEGRQMEKNKLVLLHATAIERGCDPDDPIRTVFEIDRDDGEGTELPRPIP